MENLPSLLQLYINYLQPTLHPPRVLCCLSLLVESQMQEKVGQFLGPMLIIKSHFEIRYL